VTAHRLLTRRIDGMVVRMPDDLWMKCKEHGVTSQDIMSEWKRFNMLGVKATYSTAAAAALREKTRIKW